MSQNRLTDHKTLNETVTTRKRYGNSKPNIVAHQPPEAAVTTRERYDNSKPNIVAHQPPEAAVTTRERYDNSKPNIVARQPPAAARKPPAAEVLLIGVLVCGVSLSVPQLVQPSSVPSVDQRAGKFEPTYQLTRTANERLWVQVGYQSIASVDLMAQNRVTEFRSPGPPIASSRISRDGMTFMVSLEHREIQILRNREVLISHQVPAGDEVHLSMSANGTTAILVLAGHKIRCWDLSESNPIWTDYEIPKVVTRIGLIPSGKMFAASTEEGEMDLYESKTGVPVKSWSDVGPIKSSLVFSDDDNWLAFAGHQTVSLYDMQSLNIAWQVQLGQENHHHLVAITHDGRRVAVANSRTGFQILSGSSGETICRFTHDSFPRSLDFCSSGETLFSTVGDGSIRIWPLPDVGNLE